MPATDEAAFPASICITLRNFAFDARDNFLPTTSCPFGALLLLNCQGAVRRLVIASIIAVIVDRRGPETISAIMQFMQILHWLASALIHRLCPGIGVRKGIQARPVPSTRFRPGIASTQIAATRSDPADNASAKIAWPSNRCLTIKPRTVAATSWGSTRNMLWMPI
jgi:hypothetical protein